MKMKMKMFVRSPETNQDGHAHSAHTPRTHTAHSLTHVFATWQNIDQVINFSFLVRAHNTAQHSPAQPKFVFTLQEHHGRMYLTERNLTTLHDDARRCTLTS